MQIYKGVNREDFVDGQIIYVYREDLFEGQVKNVSTDRICLRDKL